MTVRDGGVVRGPKGFRGLRGVIRGPRGFVRGINGFKARPLAPPRPRGRRFVARWIKIHVDGVLGFIAVLVGVHGGKNWVRNSCFGGK